MRCATRFLRLKSGKERVEKESTRTDGVSSIPDATMIDLCHYSPIVAAMISDLIDTLPAVPEIVRAGHPALSRRSDAVTDPTGPRTARLVAAMMAALERAGGVGLAAPQIGVPVQLVMFKVPAHRVTRQPGDDMCDLTILINPVIIPLGDERESDWEGCLSLPGLRGWVPRWRSIRYHGLTPAGERLERVVSGFHARVVQHECDHLEGCLYPQRMDDLTRFGYAEEMMMAERRFECPT